MSAVDLAGSVPPSRIRTLIDDPPRASEPYVLYWMTSARRTRFSFALQRAVEWAKELRRPLVVLEGLRCDYPWAADRHHQFVMDGMRDNARRLDRPGILYYPWVESAPGGSRGLLESLAGKACLVVADDSPAFFFPRMLEAAAERLRVRLEAVDGNGILPLSSADRLFTTAFSFRRFLHKVLPEHLKVFPKADPLARLALPAATGLALPLRRWPRAHLAPAGAGSAGGSRRKPVRGGRESGGTRREGEPAGSRDAEARILSGLPIDHGVPPVGERGGEGSGRERLRRFLDERLDGYGEERNDVEAEASSGLSPFLHFGHVSPHEVVAGLLDREGWDSSRIARRPSGSRAGWWGVSGSAEAFLDQIVTWRELGFNMCALDPRYDRFESLPAWAQKTLRDHERDARSPAYSLEEFEAARTHDDLWNAAQRQLVREGRIHGYLRMLWGKKILEWSATPREALSIMIELNNKYALDGRDPNSYSGIFWCLGRYDRPWGPERPIFGKVRYMSSESTRRKMRVSAYLLSHGPDVSPERRR